MSDDRQSHMMSDLNGTPDTERPPELKALVRNNNRLIAGAPLPFDSTPYAFVQWLSAADRRS